MRISASAFAALVAILSVCPALAGEKTVTLDVDNMYCASCAPVVKKSLARVEGVTKVEVSRETNTATVTFDDAKTSGDPHRDHHERGLSVTLSEVGQGPWTTTN